jgi:hypothetical protein
MKRLLTLSLLACFGSGYGQYYFNDLLSIQMGNEQYRLLRTQRIRQISATSYEADNTITDGFKLEEDISMDGKKIQLRTAIASGHTSVTDRFYELGKIRRTQTYSYGISNKTVYTYTPGGQVQTIAITTTDTAMKSTVLETHAWNYDNKGEPVSMWLIKNKNDSTLIELKKDEKGLVIEEDWKKNNRIRETYYYYYDAANHLTDIVRYNARLKKLIPDFQYEYDSSGKVTQMIQISMGSASYFIWKYQYNENGLKSQESGYDKDKKLAGRIVYTYTK